MTRENLIKFLKIMGVKYQLNDFRKSRIENIVISCFPSGAPVLTDSGVVPIEDICVGDAVLTKASNFKPVLHKFERTYTGDIVDVVIRGAGSRIKATSDHRIFCVRKEMLRRAKDNYYKKCYRDGAGSVSIRNIDWDIPFELVSAGDLRPGDFVSIPKIGLSSEAIIDIDVSKYAGMHRSKNGVVYKCKYEVPSIYRIDEDLAYLFGLWIAEGSVNKRNSKYYSVVFCFRLGERIAKTCRELIEKKFGIIPHTYEYPDKNTEHVVINNYLLAHWFVGLMGEGAANKRVPNIVFACSKNIIRSCVDAIRDGDGYHIKAVSKKAGSFKGISTISKTLSIQLQVLLSRLGIYFRAHERIRDGRKRSYQVNWSDSQKHCIAIKVNGTMVFPIKSVNKSTVSNVSVYNLNVADDESYSVDGIAVKNCPFAHWKHKNGVDKSLGNASIRISEPHLFHCFSCEQGGGPLGRTVAVLREFGFPGDKCDKLDAMLDEDDKNFSIGVGLFDAKDLREFDLRIMGKYVPATTRVYDYLLYRGIAIDCIDKYDIQQDRDYMVLPMKDSLGNVVGAAKRLLSTDKKDRRKRWLYEKGTCADLCLFGEQFLIGGDDVVLVEGQMDVMYMDGFKKGIRILGANGSSVSEYQVDILKRASSLTTMGDGDEGGKKLERSVKKYLYKDVPMLFKCTLPDKKDPCDLSPEKLVDLFDNRVLVRSEPKKRTIKKVHK